MDANGDGGFTYNSGGNYGADTFQYQLTDNGVSSNSPLLLSMLHKQLLLPSLIPTLQAKVFSSQKMAPKAS